MKGDNARALVGTAKIVEGRLNDVTREWQQKIIASRGRPEVFKLVRLKPLGEFIAVALYRKDERKLCLVLFTHDQLHGWQDHIVNAADITAYNAIEAVYQKVEAFNFPYNISRMLDEGRANFVQYEGLDSIIADGESMPLDIVDSTAARLGMPGNGNGNGARGHA